MPSPNTHRRRRSKVVETSTSVKLSKISPSSTQQARRPSKLEVSCSSDTSSDEAATPRTLHNSTRPAVTSSSSTRLKRREHIGAGHQTSPESTRHTITRDRPSINVFDFIDLGDGEQEEPINASENTSEESSESESEHDSKDFRQVDHQSSFEPKERISADKGSGSHINRLNTLSQGPATIRPLSQLSTSDYSDLEVRQIPLHSRSHQHWKHTGAHSDSGISVESGSPPLKSAGQYRSSGRPINPSVTSQPTYSGPGQVNARDKLEGHWQCPDASQISLDNSVQKCVTAFAGQYTAQPRHSVDGFAYAETASNVSNAVAFELPITASPQSTTRDKSTLAKSSHALDNLSGYAHLASKLSSHATCSESSETTSTNQLLTPIYRKFETLNNRILLYLQDEIAEIEEQLHELDVAIAQQEELEKQRNRLSSEKRQSGKSSSRKTMPSSRRREALFPGKLQWHRQELVARAFAKIDQYNKALTSHTLLLQTLPPASQSSIAAYKMWIQNHNPIETSEVAFLDRQEDLVSVCASPATQIKHKTPLNSTDLTTVPRQSTSPRTLPQIINLALVFLAMVIVFKVIPVLLGRLVVGGIAGVAAAAVIMMSSDVSSLCGVGVEGAWDWRRLTSIYTVGVVVLACVVD